MQIDVAVSKKAQWAGRIMSALVVLFMLFDAVIKLLKLPVVAQNFNQLGYPVSLATTIAIIALACIAVYVIPPTSALGAILLTGYFGGAIATHIRVGNPLFSHILFPVYLALLVWGGLFLREPRLRSLIPFRT
jgi:hypothetical protein